MFENYEFDPCSINEEEITLDNWKPKKIKRSIPKSEWRQKQNNCNYNQNPGIDDIKKIKMHVKYKYPDHEIMDYFGINAKTLLAIKNDCYSPIEGISLDNQSKIYKEFLKVEKKTDMYHKAFKFICDNLFEMKDDHKRKALKAIIGIDDKSSEKDLINEKE